MASNPDDRFDWEAYEADLTRQADADVVDLDDERARRAPRRRDRPTGAAAGTHFDVPLDEAPQPGGALVDVPPAGPDGRRPIVPTSLRGWANLRATVRYAVGLTAYRTGYHALRSPWYATQAGFWASVGLFRLLGRQLRWWWLSEQYGLRQAAADAKDAQLWLKLHREVKATRAWRGTVLAAELGALAIGAPVLWPLTPWWVKATAAVLGVSYLAHIGRPADRRIISPATVAGRFRRVNPDIILRAYYAAGLGHPDRPNQQITFGSTMARDASGTGSQVLIDLPFNGKTWEDVLKAKPAIAAGMDVSVNQVFVTRDPSSHRRHLLFVADRDPLAVPAGKTPLLDCKVRDIWAEAPFGLDERGRKVTLALMWISVLIGAQPRKGKTFATRLLALFAALDPYVTLLVADGKMSADWDKFRLVAHRYVCGVVPNSRDNDPIPHLLDMLREIKRHIEQVNDLLAKLPTSECPEGKITRDLSRKYPQLRVWLLVLEEFQTYFETDDQDVNKEIAGLLSFIMAVGPSAGVIILSSSQKPSGVGAGDVARLFNRYRDNHAVRFALKCGNRVVSEAILGGDAYAEGFDASTLPNGRDYRGVGILYGASDDTATVRTYLADHTDAEKILSAARKHRERAGTLTGDAAGETVAREVRDVLADVRAAFHPGEPGLHWTTIAARLAERMPEHYADLTADAASALLREHVPSVSVKVRGTVNRGARLKDLDDAINRRKSA
ncbi:cell division protein FtsK [Plantactinospora sp. BC1]|uniref:cell division protein FtsK n=1 Tax=Plantactinospora sp. BC1 TaxID=2108470 RepID=UPI000D15FD4F|nr:cell division protein FtsK [Plantactinospora sp. BC1]AVT32466.1 cell division protein FtsK [Plantactinospora sp. BC1]